MCSSLYEYLVQKSQVLSFCSYRQALEYFNFPKHFMKCLSGFSMDKVTTLGKSTGNHNNYNNDK